MSTEHDSNDGEPKWYDQRNVYTMGVTSEGDETEFWRNQGEYVYHLRKNDRPVVDLYAYDVSDIAKEAVKDGLLDSFLEDEGYVLSDDADDDEEN